MLSTGSSSPGAYSSILDGTRQIFRTEGLPGFYRGLLPSLFGVSHGALQFMAYEQLKNYRLSALERQASMTAGGHGQGQGQTRQLGNVDYLLLSGVSKVFAGAITYPYQVVRSRLQTYDAGSRYNGAWDVVKQVAAKEGLRGFYKGLGPNVLRVLPSTCVTFVVYENTRHYLPLLADGNKRSV